MSKHQKRPSSILLTLALAIAVCSPAFAQQPADSALAQIQALLNEKANRTPAQRKLDSQIVYNLKAAQGAIATGLTAGFSPAILETNKNNLVHVDIKANPVTSGLLTAIVGLGGQVESSLPQYMAVRAWIPLSASETLASRSEVMFISPAQLGHTNGQFPASLARREANVRNQLTRALPALATKKSTGYSAHLVGADTNGVIAHGADLVQTLGVTGAGVKIGVMSDGVTTITEEQLAGRLPWPPFINLLPGQSNPGPGPCPGRNCPDEGTAMLEIVYSMAPGATLYFATAGTGDVQMAANIVALRAAGCDIIVDDYTYFEGVFQDTIIAKAVNTVTAAGALYFSSAANSGNLDSNRSGTWEGDYNADGPASGPLAGKGTVHSFGATDYNVLQSKGFGVFLEWSDPYGASSNDYDLFILDPTGSFVEGASTNPQTGSQDPFERIKIATIDDPTGAVVADNSLVVIVQNAGAGARAFHLDAERGTFSIGTAGSTYGHNAGANTLTVAAAEVANAGGGQFVGGFANPPEPYSSDGPRKIFYNPAGNPVTPGNFLFATNGGTTLRKVDFTAADGVSTGVLGFGTFHGTSAAAPHAAAIAALIKSANPALTNSQISSLMYANSLPVFSFLPRTVGSGILMANLAIQTLVADLTVSKSHAPDFAQGQIGATYTIQVKNSGMMPTSGTTTVVDTLPASLTATAISGSGWTCTLATLTCTSTAVVAAGANFPSITLTVNVALNAPVSVTNSVTVSGNELNTTNNSATDPANVIQEPDLILTKSHSPNYLTEGQVDSYTLIVSNIGFAPTSGATTVTDTLPATLTPAAMGGSGWTCNVATLTCTSTAVVPPGGHFPPITLGLFVAENALLLNNVPQVHLPVAVINKATVSGGGELNTANDSAMDAANINPKDGYQVHYFANLNIGDSAVNFTNTGFSGGNVCVSLYAFDPAEELIACCTCAVTPNALQSLSVLKSMISNPLTPAIPTSVVIKAIASSPALCNASAVTMDDLVPGLRIWGTTLHALPTSPVAYGMAETPFSNAVLSDAELAHVTTTCGFIQSNGSGFGICKGCVTGGLGASPSQ